MVGHLFHLLSLYLLLESVTNTQDESEKLVSVVEILKKANLMVGVVSSVTTEQLFKNELKASQGYFIMHVLLFLIHCQKRQHKINQNICELITHCLILLILTLILFSFLQTSYYNIKNLCLCLSFFVCQLLLHDQELRNQTWHTCTSQAPQSSHLYQISKR